jgi:hypothetical protein
MAGAPGVAAAIALISSFLTACARPCLLPIVLLLLLPGLLVLIWAWQHR